MLRAKWLALVRGSGYPKRNQGSCLHIKARAMSQNGYLSVMLLRSKPADALFHRLMGEHLRCISKLKRNEGLFNHRMVHSRLQAVIIGQRATPAGIIKFLHRRGR